MWQRSCRLLQVGEQHLDGEPAAPEDDRLDAVGHQEAARRSAGLQQRAAADAELAVHDRRVVEDDVLSPAGAPFLSTSATGSSSSRSASSPGLAMVAEQQMNCGCEP